ncbi:MAG: glycoside hydrolase family 78 protein [Bacteroidales bacterium]
MDIQSKLTLILLAALAIAAQRPSAPGSPLQPTSLRVEYLVDPLAVDTREPRLSWEFKDIVERSVRQAAYQVVVAASAEQLVAGKADVWDSGKVASPRSAQVAYAGRPLKSRERCFWRVRVWDGSGRVSAWSAPAEWSVGLLDSSDWTAQWVGDREPSKDDPSATMLRRVFALSTPPRRAVAYVSALGMYELRINGRRVGAHQLAPEWTDYRARVQYQAYDITPYLRAGENVAGAILADGWYAGGIGLTEAMGRQRRNIYGDHPRLLVQMEIDIGDATHLRVVSNDAWRITRHGPVRSADILNGETYDARREIAGWDAPGFVDAGWLPAAVASDVKVPLVAQPNEAIAATEEVRPIAVKEPRPGTFVFDLGQNMVGWCRLTLRGEAGATATLRHAEMLNDDGTIYTENLRAAAQTDRFTLAGRGDETFEPRFTYHGFRYVEVTGKVARPKLEDLVGVVVHSNVPAAGTFESSNALMNQLWKNIRWTQRGNMHSIPTDCPQRDERLGWMGDILVFAQTAAFNFDMAAFFKKWTVDVRDAQAADGRFPDFAPHPYEPDKRFSGAPGWGDAGVVVPWRAYENYGDVRIIEGQYEAAKRWVEFIRRENPDLLWKNKRGNDYGDWLNADTLVQQGWPKTGGEVPKAVFATTMFAHSTDLVARMARVLGRPDDAAKYGRLFEDIKAAFNQAYVQPDGRIEGDTQAGYALALYFDLLPEPMRPKAVDRMVAGLDRYNGHMSTGFHSTYRMMLELTRARRSDLAYKLALERTFPSWGYSIDNGATTIWERWDGYVKGRGFQDKGMNSFNHYAIGAVGEWLYRVVLGINPDPEHPGYEHVIIRPVPGGGLTSAKGSYHSIRGNIEVAWTQDADRLALDVVIPPNVTATIHVPASNAGSVTEGVVPATRATGVRFVRADPGTAVFNVGSGHYHFRVGR